MDDMEKEEQEKVRAAVEEILAEADIDKVSEREVPNLAAEKTGIDLSACPRRNFVSLESRNYLPITKTPASSDALAEDSKPSRGEQTPKNKLRVVQGLRRVISEMKKTEKMADIKMKGVVDDQEPEDDDEEALGGGRMHTRTRSLKELMNLKG